MFCETIVTDSSQEQHLHKYMTRRFKIEII